MLTCEDKLAIHELVLRYTANHTWHNIIKQSIKLIIKKKRYSYIALIENVHDNKVHNNNNKNNNNSNNNTVLH